MISWNISTTITYTPTRRALFAVGRNARGRKNPSRLSTCWSCIWEGIRVKNHTSVP